MSELLLDAPSVERVQSAAVETTLTETHHTYWMKINGIPQHCVHADADVPLTESDVIHMLHERAVLSDEDIARFIAATATSAMQCIDGGENSIRLQRVQKPKEQAEPVIIPMIQAEPLPPAPKSDAA